MVPEGKSRITVTLGNRVIEKLDEYCEMTGLTRSAAVGSIVAGALVLERPVLDLYRGGMALPPDVEAEIRRRDLQAEGLV